MGHFQGMRRPLGGFIIDILAPHRRREELQRDADRHQQDQQIGRFIRMMEKMMRTLEETLVLVEAQSSSVESISTLLAGIKKQLDEALGGALTPSQQMRVDAIFNKAQANKDALDAAIKANDGVTDEDEKAASRVEVTSSANPANVGDTIVLSGSVAGDGPIPTGTVTFAIDGSPLGSGSLDADGVAVYTLSTALPVGDHQVVASYGGDAAYQKDESETLTQTVLDPAQVGAVGGFSGGSALAGNVPSSQTRDDGGQIGNSQPNLDPNFRPQEGNQAVPGGNVNRTIG